MVSEEEQIVAFLFKRSGKEEMSISEAHLTLSMDLNWFSPDDAKKFIQNVIEKKLLQKKAEVVSPSFEIGKINIPLGFKPSINIDRRELTKEITAENNLVFEEIIEKIKDLGEENEEDILKRINQVKKEKKTNIEVAAAYVAMENNIDLNELFNKIEKTIFTKNKE